MAAAIPVAGKIGAACGAADRVIETANKAVDLFKKVFGSESSSKMGELNIQQSFTALNQRRRLSAPSEYKSQDGALRILKRILGDFKVPPETIDSMIDVLKEAASEKQECYSMFSWISGAGGLAAMCLLYWKPEMDDADKPVLGYYLADAQFKMAPDYRIVTKSKKSLFKSKNHDSIVETPHNLSVSDYQLIISEFIGAPDDIAQAIAECAASLNSISSPSSSSAPQVAV